MNTESSPVLQSGPSSARSTKPNGTLFEANTLRQDVQMNVNGTKKGGPKLSLGLKKKQGPTQRTSTQIASQVIVNQTIVVSEIPSGKTSTSKQTSDKNVKFPDTKKAYNQASKELAQGVDSLMGYFIQNIVLKSMRIGLALAFVILQLIALPINIAIKLFCISQAKKEAHSFKDIETASTTCCRSKHVIEQERQKNEWKKEQQQQLRKCIDSKENFSQLKVVLDLDNTLIHSIDVQPLDSDTNYFEIRDGIYVFRRPYLSQFLQYVNEIALEYADQIIDVIDPTGIIKRRFYRDDCKKDQFGNFYKDLKTVSNDLSSLIMIDDSQLTVLYNKDNTYKIENWTKGMTNDTCLKHCLTFLQQMQFSQNVPNDLSEVQSLNRAWSYI